MTQTSLNSTSSTTTPVPPVTEEKQSGWTFVRVITVATVGLVALLVLIFAIALAIAILNPQGVSDFLSYVRDVVLIMLFMQLILIITGVGILIIQIARFVNLLRSEVQPIAKETKETLQTVRTTTEFVGKQAAAPLITINAFLAGLFTFTKTLFSVKALMNLMKKPKKDGEE
jgi:amino acid transporter